MANRIVRERVLARSRPSMRARRAMLACLAGVVLGGVSVGFAQQSAPFHRLPPDELDVLSPSDRVTGAPGEMRASQAGCERGATPLNAELRRRIVDVAVQEWAFFGFGISDQTASQIPGRGVQPPARSTQRRGRSRRVSVDESARVAASIAGYWTVTPEGGWIIDQQNDAWTESGIGARWRSPWSAAFISWVMCESGLTDASQFQRAVAHHRYIDQAIRARDGGASRASFVAYDAGEAPVEPGDLLCSGRRPAYTTLSERRRQMGEGARTHCDIVVKVDVEHTRILAIGGNVRSAVTLKVLPAMRGADEALRPWDFSDTELDDNPYRGARPIFAHLKLRADALGAAALERSKTIRALNCSGGLTAQSGLIGLLDLRAVGDVAGACGRRPARLLELRDGFRDELGGGMLRQ